MEGALSDEEDVNCPPRFPVKVITVSDGKALLDVSKIREILFEGGDVSEKDLKVACICIIGQEASGKSFLTNMILQYLIANGNGNWIGRVTKKKDRLEGFSWNQQNTKETPSVKMLSRPFSLKKSNGERILLLLMDISAPLNDFQSQKLMEALACLLCPTVVVNQLHNIDVDFLNSYKAIIDRKQPIFSQRVFFSIRDYSPDSKKLLSYGQAKEKMYDKYMEELLKSSNRQELSTLWGEIKHKEVFAFTAPGNPTIMDQDGYLTLQSAFIAQIKKFVNEILDVEDISHYHVPSMETIIEHFQETISWLNKNSDSLLSTDHSMNVALSKSNESTTKKNKSLKNEQNDLNEMPKKIEMKEKFPCPSITENFLRNFADSKLDQYRKDISSFDQSPTEKKIDVPVTPFQEGHADQEFAEILSCYNTAKADNSSERIQSENFAPKAIPNFVQENTQVSIVTQSNDCISPKKSNTKSENSDFTKETLHGDISRDEEFEQDNVSDLRSHKTCEENSEKMSMNEVAKLENCTETKNSANANIILTTHDVCKSFETSEIMHYPVREENTNNYRNDDVQDGNTFCLTPHQESKDLKPFNETSNLEKVTNIENLAGTSKTMDTYDVRHHLESSKTTEYVNPKEKIDIKRNGDVQQANVNGLTTQKDLDKGTEDLISFDDAISSQNITKSDFPNKSTNELDLHLPKANPFNEENTKKQLPAAKGPNSENSSINSNVNNFCQNENIAEDGLVEVDSSEKIKKQLPEIVKVVDRPVDGKQICKLPVSEDSNYLSSSPPSKIEQLSSEQKHELDQKLQDQLDRITQSYTDSLNHFATSERSLSTEKLQNKHFVLAKSAIEKLERFCNQLKLKEGAKQEYLNTLRKSLNFKHEFMSKKLNKKGNKEKPGKLPKENSIPPTMTLKQENAVPVSSSPFTSTANIQASALKERTDKLLASYDHSIISFIQTSGEDVELLGNFHKAESEKKLKHIREVFQNISNADLSRFQNQLDEVYSKYVTVPEEDRQESFTDEEYQQRLADNTNHSISMMMIATEYILKKYDSYMESSSGEICNLAQLNFCHHNFFKKFKVPEFWSPFGDQLNFLVNVPNILDHFNSILLKRLAFYEQRLRNEFAKEEHAKKLTDSTNQSALMAMKATEYVHSLYDAHMENSLGRMRTVDQLSIFHQNFLSSLTTTSFWAQFGHQTAMNAYFKVPNVTEDLKKSLSKRFSFYEQRFKQHVREQQLMTALLKCCSETYKAKIYDEVGMKISETGFYSAAVLVKEVHEDFVRKIVKNSYPANENNLDGLICILNTNIKQELQNVLKLETILNAYIKEWDNLFVRNICFSDNILKDHREAAKEIALNHPIAKVNNENFIKMSRVALDYAFSWCLNRNKEIQKAETEAAHLAMDIVKGFYKNQMDSVMKGKLYSSKQLTQKHRELKIQCVKAFREAAIFYSNSEKTGLEDFSSFLESEIENFLNEYLKANEKAMEDAVKKLQSIISGSTKNFKEIMNGNLVDKSYDPLEFESLYEDVSNQILEKAKDEVSKKIPTEGLQPHEENIKNQMENDIIYMREANKTKRNDEILKLRKEREEHLKNESTRGCTLPFLCIEFNLTTFQAGFTQPNDKFTNLIDARGNIIMENRISFLKEDEFVVGTVAKEKSKNILETVLLENLLDSSNESSDSKKEIEFRGENLEINLELFCSLVFTSLKESAEKQSKEKFSTVVISVPLWFASRHRQVVKATALIAGFEEVFLINDTSAAALGYFKSATNISNCLVAAAGKDSCNAAVYSYCDEKMKMTSCFGDLHINKEKSFVQKTASFLSSLSPINFKAQEDNIYSTVLKEIKCEKNVENALIVFTTSADVNSISKAIESKGIKSVTISENPVLENNGVMNGLLEYSRLLAQNIKFARESVSDLMQYTFTVTEDVKDHSKELIPKHSKYNFGNQSQSPRFKKFDTKTLSFYEEATPLKRFHYGISKFIVNKDDKFEMKVTASQEGIYDVELSMKEISIAIDSYALNSEQRSKYSALLEKHFKKDPALEQLQKAKDLMKEIAQDMNQRFPKITAKSDILRESILKDIKDAIALADSQTVDLETVKSKTKTLETWREKKFPKK